MKRNVFLWVSLMLVLLVGAFLGGMSFTRSATGDRQHSTGQRRVLHYVDPMNPAHTSDKPGVAPCGMPMEPVYEDEESTGKAPQGMPAGTVKITPQKQQMIGVRVGGVEMESESHTVRTLGRVAPDENRVFRMVAGSDGWMGQILGSTTGSLVQKDQLLATFYVKDFTLKQRQFLAFPDYPTAPVPQPQPQPQVQPQPEVQSQPQADGHQGRQPEEHQMHQGEAGQPAEHQMHQMGENEPPMEPPAGEESDEDQRSAVQVRMEEQARAAQSRAQLRQPLYPSFQEQKLLAKLDLMSLGVDERQLREIARTMQFAESIELRSPASGIVLSRNVSSGQRFDKGSEFFKIADLSRVWVVADVFGREAEYIRAGTNAKVVLPDRDKTFAAVVSDVSSLFDPVTRALKVRLEVDNPEGLLRPDMFTDVEFLISLPPAVTVPADAILESGVKKTVFVELGNGFFEPRSVKTGWRFGGKVEVLEGLMPGERIVLSGNFLIDSESRMKLAAAGLFGVPEKDPVCGADVYPNKAKSAGLTSSREGKTVYFCSEGCKADFDGEPAGKASTPAGGEPRGAEKAPAPRTTAKDPVCEMQVSSEKSKAAGWVSEAEGQTVYFCSRQCKQQFDRAPQRYLRKPPADSSRKSPSQGGHKHD